jgi:hypothetical protein
MFSDFISSTESTHCPPQATRRAADKRAVARRVGAIIIVARRRKAGRLDVFTMMVSLV